MFDSSLRHQVSKRNPAIYSIAGFFLLQRNVVALTRPIKKPRPVKVGAGVPSAHTRRGMCQTPVCAYLAASEAAAGAAGAASDAAGAAAGAEAASAAAEAASTAGAAGAAGAAAGAGAGAGAGSSFLPQAARAAAAIREAMTRDLFISGFP